MKTERQVWYEEEGLAKGMTVAEFEEYYLLPPYSVYPEAAEAKTWSDKGFFMYRNATDEEREAMATRAGRPRAKLSEEERKERRKKYLHDWYAANRKAKAA